MDLLSIVGTAHFSASLQEGFFGIHNAGFQQYTTVPAEIVAKVLLCQHKLDSHTTYFRYQTIYLLMRPPPFHSVSVPQPLVFLTSPMAQACPPLRGSLTVLANTKGMASLSSVVPLLWVNLVGDF